MSFRYFGRDAVKALRAAIEYQTLQGRRDLGWTEIPVGWESAATLVWEQTQFDKSPSPLCCLPNNVVLQSEGALSVATIALVGAEFDVAAVKFMPASGSPEIRHYNCFALRLLNNFLEVFGLNPSADWDGLTKTFLPAHLLPFAADKIISIPKVDTSARTPLEEQVQDLAYWAYREGLLCPLLIWLDGAFRR